MQTIIHKSASLPLFLAKKFRLRSSRILIALTAAISASLLAAQSFGQNNKTSSENEDERTKQLIELSSPGENHALLAQKVGKWTFSGKHSITNSDGSTKIVVAFNGTVERKSIWGGRYFMVETTGGKIKAPWAGDKEVTYMDMAIEAYDNAKKKFMLAKIDNNRDTGIIMFEGSYDAKTNTIIYEGAVDDAPGVRRKLRDVVKMIDKDHYTFAGDQGNGVTTEINYVRAESK